MVVVVVLVIGTIGMNSNAGFIVFGQSQRLRRRSAKMPHGTSSGNYKIRSWDLTLDLNSLHNSGHRVCWAERNRVIKTRPRVQSDCHQRNHRKKDGWLPAYSREKEQHTRALFVNNLTCGQFYRGLSCQAWAELALPFIVVGLPGGVWSGLSNVFQRTQFMFTLDDDKKHADKSFQFLSYEGGF